MLSLVSPSLLLSLCVALVLASDDSIEVSQYQLVNSGKHSINDIDANQKVIRITMLHLPPYLNVTRNSTGQVVEVKGVTVPIIEWLSRALDFEYVLLSDNIYSVEDNAAGKGLMTTVIEGRADLILGAVTLSASRYKKLNFIYPFVFGRFGMAIPTPKSQINVAAVWLPFQNQVWMFFFISFSATIIFTYSINYGTSRVVSKRRQNRKFFQDFGQAWLYVIGVLLSQSILVQRETFGDRKLSIRILAGTWCVACFVLVTAYSSVLISFITSPYYKPLINSIYDLPGNPKVKIVVDRGLFADIIFNSAEDGIFKYLGDQLRKDPELRCNTTEKCLDKVRNGSYIYTQGFEILTNYIGTDLKRTGHCDFTIAKESFLNTLTSFAVPKHVDIEYYNRGMLKAHEGGFIGLWSARNMADASRCLNPVRKHPSEKISLKLGGLSGAFVVLIFGYSLSLLLFFGEVSFKFFCKP